MDFFAIPSAPPMAAQLEPPPAKRTCAGPGPLPGIGLATTCLRFLQRPRIFVPTSYFAVVQDLRDRIVVRSPFDRPAERGGFVGEFGLKPTTSRAAQQACASPSSFFASARGLPNPFLQDRRPLPGSLLGAISYIAENPTAVPHLRSQQLAALAAASARLAPVTESIRQLVPEYLRGITAPVDFGLIAALVDAMDYPDKRLVHDLTYGFVNVGVIPERGIFRPEVRPATMDMASVFSPESNRAYNAEVRARLSRSIKSERGA